MSLLFANIYSSLISARCRSLLVVVNLCLFIVDLCSSLATSLAHLRLHLLGSISLLLVTWSLYSLPAMLPGRLCLQFTSIANIAHSPPPIQIYDYLSLSLSLSLRFKLSSLISLFSIIWICRSVILFGYINLLFGFADLFFGFLVVDLLNHWFCSLGLCLIFVFLVEI